MIPKEEVVGHTCSQTKIIGLPIRARPKPFPLESSEDTLNWVTLI